jgi:serine/threonine protein kinase
MKDFTIIEELGNQLNRKFSKVFLVRSESNMELFVLKIVEKKEETILQQKKLITESKFNLEAPFFQRNIKFWEDDKSMFLLKEFIPGETLDVWWKNEKKIKNLDKLKLFISKAVCIFQELKNGKIVHNDIKPTNFIVSEKNSEIKLTLIDFGLAHSIPAENDGEVLFSLGFSAPEVVLSKKSITNHSSDLFSLGICMYFLYAGKLPLSHPNPSIFTNLQITHPLINDAGIPKKLFDLLSKICVKHSFRLPPNQLPEAEVNQLLILAQQSRIQTIEEIQRELNTITEKKFWNLF